MTRDSNVMRPWPHKPDCICAGCELKRRSDKPDRAMQADVALEAEIDAAYQKMVLAPTDDESREWFGRVNILIQRRSPTQLLKLEMERRARAKAKRA